LQKLPPPKAVHTANGSICLRVGSGPAGSGR